MLTRSLATAVALAAGALLTVTSGAPAGPQPAVAAFDRLKALAGEWVDVDGSLGMKGQVAVVYRVTGGGNSVIETLFAGQPHEMTTVYSRDGRHVVLTHHCAAGNQPRMRAQSTDGASLAFDYDGGTNLDPARDGHMHNGRIEFVGPDLVRAQWIGWQNGKPSGHSPTFNLARKKA